MPSEASSEKSATDVAYERIREKIVEGEFRPSQRLVEATLAENLGVSRHNVRVALGRLQSDGLVRIEPNHGATVATLGLEDTLDILVAREALEAEVARLAAERVSAAELEQLEACLRTMKLSLEQSEFENYSKTNRTFHQIIYRASGNGTMPELIALLRLRMARLHVRTILIPGRSDKSLAEHTGILDALREGDADGAEAALRTHMKSLREAIRKAWNLVGV
ncbi:MAG TPA: GntR family transcriptional regulator [Trueperaceae bacterium]